MTSPEWEAANEDDSDRFPQTSHTSASESTESHEQGSRVVPDPARVARYAEAIYEAASVVDEAAVTVALRVSCPRCGERVGQRCRKPNGDFSTFSHQSRLDLALGNPWPFWGPTWTRIEAQP